MSSQGKPNNSAGDAAKPPRRDRRRCVHYDEEVCTITAPVPSCCTPFCIGPAKCGMYKERKAKGGANV